MPARKKLQFLNYSINKLQFQYKCQKRKGAIPDAKNYTIFGDDFFLLTI